MKTITKTATATESGFCSCCGHRYEPGVQMVRVAESFQRGRWAVKSHVDAINAKIAKRETRDAQMDAVRRTWLGANINVHD